jgi:hypothetical protein
MNTRAGLGEQFFGGNWRISNTPNALADASYFMRRQVARGGNSAQSRSVEVEFG